MEIENYINAKKKFYKRFMKFIDNQNANDRLEDNVKLIQMLENQQIAKKREELQLLLCLISKISKNHHRSPNFINKILQILLFFKTEIEQTFSNSEIFHFFKGDKLLLLYLIENEFITIDESIVRMIYKRKQHKFCHFFFPEIKRFISDEKRELFERELLNHDPNIFDDFEKNRKIGENDSFICHLIRNDSIEHFVTFVNQTNFSLSSTIKPSIFETNSFLLKNETSLIEYAAFFGSLQIFQFLKFNRVFLRPILWFYSIHGRNAEIIHLLEENCVEPDDKTFVKRLNESVKCHHNEIANYINVNLISDYRIIEKFGGNVADYGFRHSNYEYLSIDLNNDAYVFYYACHYDYLSIVKLFLKKKDLNVNAKIVSLLIK